MTDTTHATTTPAPERPARPLSNDELDALDRDGVIMASGLFPEHWITRMTAATDRIIEVGTEFGELVSMRDKGFSNDLFMWTEDDDFRAFVFESPAAHIAGQVLARWGSTTVTHWYDQLFVKQIGAQVPTPWHQDLTFWPVEGEQLVSIWITFDPVTRDTSGLEFVRGSHRWPNRYKAVSPDYHPYLLESDLEDPPDVEAHREQYDLLGWDMQPGDCLIFHPVTLHGSLGNYSTTTARRALSSRWLGDEVTYAPRHATMPVPDERGLTPGEHLSGTKLFPQVLPEVVPAP